MYMFNKHKNEVIYYIIVKYINKQNKNWAWKLYKQTTKKENDTKNKIKKNINVKIEFRSCSLIFTSSSKSASESTYIPVRFGA